MVMIATGWRMLRGVEETPSEQVLTAVDVVKAVCGARKRQGSGTCQREAGWGTDHLGSGSCKLHGGCTRNHNLAALRAEAVDASRQFGGFIDIDPADALLLLVGKAAANVAFWGARVEQLDQSGQVRVEREGGASSTMIEASIVGRNHAGDGAIHVAAAQFGDWCDRLVRYAKTAIDAGIAERHVRLAEAQGKLVGDLLRAIFGDPELGLSDGQRQAAEVVANRHLSVLAARAEAA